MRGWLHDRQYQLGPRFVLAQDELGAPMIGLTPAVTEAVTVRHGVLCLVFADGLTGEVEVLERMRDPCSSKPADPMAAQWSVSIARRER